MNLRDLNYFVVLAELKHFGDAAKQCFVSQPTLSMQIKKLEDSLGVPLFERTNKKVFLTTQGEELLDKAKKIVLLVDEMKELARQSHDPYAGDLYLGVIPTVAPYLLPKVMPEIKTIMPQLKIWLVEEQTQRLIDQLEDGTLDAAIMAQPVTGDFDFQHLYDEEFYFACSSQHPLAQSQTVKISDLEHQHVLLLEEGHCFREQAIAVCQEAKSNEIADFSATSLETLRLMVQSGIGVTLLPALAVGNETSDLLHCIPFAKPAPQRSIGLFWRKSTPKQLCLKKIGHQITQLIGSSA